MLRVPSVEGMLGNLASGEIIMTGRGLVGGLDGWEGEGGKGSIQTGNGERAGYTAADEEFGAVALEEG